MKKIVFMCVCLSLLAAVNNAQASWTQSFVENGIGAFDFVAVNMVSPGDSFESLTHRNMLAGWSVEYENDSTFPTLATASGPSTTDMSWDIVFAGSMSDPLFFDFVAFDGDTLKESIHSSWSGSGWQFSNSSWTPQRSELTSVCTVPVPGALLLSGIGMGLTGWMRKRRTL